MKKSTLIILLLSAGLFAFTFTETNWTFDKNHSRLGFSVTHMMVNDVKGSFKIKELTLVAPGDDFTNASINLIADAASVNTENEARDSDLRKPDFFDTEKYPEVKFKSKSFKKIADNKYAIEGDLTIKDVTKEITLQAVVKTGTDPMKNKPLAGFKVSGPIKRSDFGIAKSAPEAILSDVVMIEADLEFGVK